MKEMATATLERDPVRHVLAEEHPPKDAPAGTVGASSVVGEVREENQDSILTLDVAPNATGIRRALMVADGAGGCHGGLQASRQAALVVRELMAALPVLHPAAPDAPGWASRSLEALGRWIGSSVDGNLLALQAADPSLKSMATTMTLALEVAPESPESPPRALLVHLGDSRAYLVGNEGLEQITRDHSKAAILRERGTLSDAINILWGCFPGNGVDEYLQVSVRELMPDTMLLLCSDGLWNELTNDDILAVLSQRSDLQKTAEDLADLACHYGGHDNISIVLARAVEQPLPATDYQNPLAQRGEATNLSGDAGSKPARNGKE